MTFDRELLQQALDALQTAHRGLEWYRDESPDLVNGADDEADEEILFAITSLEKALLNEVKNIDPAQVVALTEDRIRQIVREELVGGSGASNTSAEPATRGSR